MMALFRFLGFMAFIALLVWGVESCDKRLPPPPPPAYPPLQAKLERRGNRFSVWHDEEHLVTCWIVQQGVSCLPDSQIERKPLVEKPAP